MLESTKARAHGHDGRRGLVVLVASGSAAVRDLVLRRLSLLPRYEARLAANAAEARAASASLGARTVCITAATLPDGTGARLLDELRTIGHPRGVLLTPTRDPFPVRGAIASGVRALLVVPQLRRRDMPMQGSENPNAVRRELGALSQREIEVLALVADGRTNREIGEALGLSALTVKSHLARTGRKLNTGDRAEMVAVALRAGVID